MTKVTAKTEFKYRGKVNQELASQYRSGAEFYGAERPKKDAATAKRAATTLKNYLESLYFPLKPEQCLALKAAASVLATLAADLDGVAAWAKSYKAHCDAERVRTKEEAEDALAEKLWAGDDALMLADARELVELFSAPGKELMGEFLKQSKTFEVMVMPDLDSQRFYSLTLAATAQPTDLKKLRRDAAYCVDQILSQRSYFDKNYRDEVMYCAGGQDYRSLKAWRKSVRATVSACAPPMSTIQTPDSSTEIPTDAAFWSGVAAFQAADDAEEEAFEADIHRPDQ